MNAQKTDRLIQYALAVAAEQDHIRDRELRPIHLIKYCYLGDLAFAREHAGQSYTGTSWKFHHYGPWSRDLFLRLEPAAKAIGAVERHFSTERQEDAVSWTVRPEQANPPDIANEIPGAVASAIKNSVREFGSDTVSLLHHVYTTEPMLNAAPGELLDLAPSPPAERPRPEAVAAEETLRPKPLSKTTLKKLRAGVQARSQELRQRRSVAVGSRQASPPYDEIFSRGQAWLDSLAGGEVACDEGRITFGESIWKSAGRRAPRLP